MKKALLLLLALALLAGVLSPAAAEENLASGSWTYTLRPDGTAKITSFKGTSYNLLIPRELDGNRVTAIGTNAFRNVQGLMTVALLDPTVEIEKNAYSDRRVTLETVELPDSLVVERYRAKNKTVVNYYLYVPETEDPTEKLPILIYFHGNRDTMDRHHGIGELLRTEQISPKGIVILPQAINETIDDNFHKTWYQDAVIELANEIAEKYNGDMNRLSVSGHSDGGTAVYQIVNNHPGLFAAAAPISAIGNTGEGIRKTSLWVFQGRKDFWVNKDVGLRVVLKCEQAGCDARHYIYKMEGHDIQTMVWQDTFPDDDGSEVRLIDWLMGKKLK